MTVAGTAEVVVVGGGAAGLSAALVLGRACRRTLLLDGEGQSNRRAPQVGGLIGWEGPPGELYHRIRAQLSRYREIETRTAMATDVRADGDGFVVHLDGGGQVECARVLLATGMHYDRPGVSGLEDLWGGPVFHCPYCHGWEMRDRALGVLGADAHAAHRALLLREWSPHVALLTDGEPAVGDAGIAALTAAGIPRITTPVTRLLGRGDGLEVEFGDGTRRYLDGLLVAAPMRRRTDLGLRLGVALNPGGEMRVGEDQRTSVPGLYAAGDVSSRHGQVVLAAAAGARAGMEIHADLVDRRWGWSPERAG